MSLLWIVDRAAGLVAYPALYMAVLTGIFYNSTAFGSLCDASRRIHVEVSTFATIMVIIHSLLGVVDTLRTLENSGSELAFSTTYFLGGVGVGVGGLGLLVVSVLGFLDARRWDRPWGPRTVHAFAYAGFAFATIHAIAIGTTMGDLVRPLVVPTMGFLVYVLLLRLLASAGAFEATPE